MKGALLFRKFNIKINAGVGSRPNIVNTIQEITENDDFYIQEIEGAFPGFIENNVKMLNPKIAIVTGLKEKFSNNYKDKADYEQDALSLIDLTIENGGTVFVNIDDPILSKLADRENIKTLSLKSKNADYYLNGKVKGKYIDALISLKEEKDIINTRINLQYSSDMISVLAAYAV